MAQSPKITVDAVIVPPGRDGLAFGHDARGRCVELTGSREAMLELCRRLREAELTAHAHRVRIDPKAWPGINAIEPIHCPMHALDQRAGGDPAAA